jgi:2-dehydro-3-deoxyphosphogluconate aldolase / (4S)-4-hydroxy-2-oxoglutarate aldolase
MPILDEVLKHKIVAVIRLHDYKHAVETARALVAGGIPVLEFTLTGQGAIDAVVAARQALGDTVVAGVGTVLKAEEAEAAIAAGAQFVVTPAVRPAVIAACVNHGALSIAGGLTPTELLQAYEAGSQLVKVFPAQVGGPRYIKDVLAPLPFLKLVPTGGISAENARDFLAAGAVAVGIGGNLVSNRLVAEGAFAQITAAAQACVAALAAN